MRHTAGYRSATVLHLGWWNSEQVAVSLLFIRCTDAGIQSLLRRYDYQGPNNHAYTFAISLYLWKYTSIYHISVIPGTGFLTFLIYRRHGETWWHVIFFVCLIKNDVFFVFNKWQIQKGQLVYKNSLRINEFEDHRAVTQKQASYKTQ